MTWRDPSGRTLADYPHPSVAVDVALLTVADDQLCVLLHQGRSLPGTFLRVEETLRDAALRVLREKAGVTGEEPRQLAVFDDPARDDRGRVLSVAHVDLVPAARLTGALTPVDALPPLAFDHAAIVDAAAAWARDAHRDRPDPRGLLDEEFTLLELQRLHEAVRGGPLPKDTFRRRMQEHLIDTGTLSRGTVGKPARVFRRAPQETP
ncbi:NUDIX hydrolase [Pseudonocardia abyssalis]|jgi:ADP-ribose pyrophosphatase YjhB (NUDIX family)|uniref:NUDIX hydrolase n=1 Tax=Pseudonocardia abyssalis TaxID=2792008 RepID=A0ABS6UL40_9PSEU|nr:NUDIX domain-containing protein [Pseudonocardia abyssalis]MBW0119076.1 NUDIX hydrolase [Pseudonocardia abyssalis]MBW0132945.1 NUDIX hydrolase [Pseudonocardia abyssalis]